MRRTRMKKLALPQGDHPYSDSSSSRRRAYDEPAARGQPYDLV
jgi:hypothetical protein